MEEVHRVIHDAVLEAGAKKIAFQMGTTHTGLLNRTNPETDSHRLNFDQFLQILVHTNDMRPLKALADAFGFDLVSREGVTAKDLTGAVLHMHAEVADVTRAVTEAMADGRLSRMEKELIKREIGQAQNGLDVLLESVKVA